MWLVVGLGNPGPEYAHTRHNIGFMVVEALARRYGATFRPSRQARAEVAEIRIDDERVVLVKPLTYMNLSGEAVRPLLQWYRLTPDRLLVVYDDLDLPFGRLRIRPRGSSGGHGGMRSIIEHLGTEAFPRLRIGIGRPVGPARVYVLQPFTPEEQAQVPAIIERAVQAVETIIREGLEAAMNRFNA